MNVAANRGLAEENGGRYLSSTSGSVTGDFGQIYAISASTVNLQQSNVSGSPSSVTLAAGQVVRGVISQISVVSGTIVAYYRKWIGPVEGFTNKNAFGAEDYIDWSQLGGAGTTISVPASVTSNRSKTATVSALTSLYAMVQGTNWAGNFSPGDALLYSWGNTEITITMGSAVAGLGCQIQSSQGGPYYGEIDVYDVSDTKILNFKSYGVSNSNADGSAVFIGARSQSKNIKKVVFSLFETSKPGKFVINRLLIV